jgi:hypothetical protein
LQHLMDGETILNKRLKCWPMLAFSLQVFAY